MQRIFHMTETAVWARAIESGSFNESTRGLSLDEVGFIHCSFENQVAMVADFVYPDWVGELVLLEIDPERVDAEIKVESVDDGDAKFPHVYGPVPTSAITAVHALKPDSTGWKVEPSSPR